MNIQDNIYQLRDEFPILQTKIGKYPLVYFDNAATTQKPNCVIDTLKRYYTTQNANIHRGVHYLSQKSTEDYEASRNYIAQFIHAKNSYEIVFTRGTTEAINLVAQSFCSVFLQKDDEIIITHLEHHSNIVPWQLACEKHGAKLKVIPINQKGELQIENLETQISDKTKLIAVAHVSNALGTIIDIKKIIEIAHKNYIPVLVDGAQGIAHDTIDVTALDCDFYCFSAHKVYGPMGIGVLYGKEKWLEAIPPYQGGGEMIKEVHFEKTTYNELPFKFEAGTPNVGDAIAFKTALEFVAEIGMQHIKTYENALLEYATKKLATLEYIDFIGTAKEKAAVLSFNIKGVHPYDAGVILDKLGIAVRTGHHCAQPLMNFYQIPGTIRASFACYNTFEEIDIFVEAVKKATSILL